MRRADARALLLLSLAVVLPFPRLLRLDSIPLSVDTPAFHLPLWRFLLDTLGRGELPLWCSGIYLGYPLHAYGEAGLLYLPHHFVALLMPSPGACVAFLLLLHHIVAALGMYALCRLGFSVGPAASAVGGLCFSLGGYMVLRQTTAGFFAACSWAPLCLLASLPRVYERRPLLAAFVLLLPLVSGHALAWAMSLLLWAALNLGATAVEALRGDLRGALSRLGKVALTFCLHLALGAAQVLPGAEFVLHSPRAKGLTIEEAALLSMEPRHLPLLVAPWLCGRWGGPRCPSYAFAFGAWAGLGGLLLAVAGLLSPSTRRRALLPAALAAVGAWTALGPEAGLFALLHKLPGLRLFRCPNHFLLWWSLGLSLLAALGAEAVAKASREFRALLRRAFLLAAGAALIVSGLAGGLPSALPPLAAVALQACSLPASGGLLPLSIWAEVALEARQVRRFMRAWRLERPLSVAQVLRSSDGRVRALNTAGGDRRFFETEVRGQMGLLWNVKILVEPGKPMSPLRYALAFPRLLRNGRLRKAAAVKFLLLRRWDFPSARRVMARGLDVLFRLDEGAPFVRLAGRAVVARSLREALRLTEQVPPDTVVIEIPPGAKLSPTRADVEGEASIVSEGPNSFLLSARTRAPALLVLSQMWYPGWRAWVDERPVPIFPADFVAEAVPLPSGSHLAWLVFHPSTFSVGLYISLLSLAALLGALVAKIAEGVRAEQWRS